MRRDYREDIDWLRAIAVLAVVAFHFEMPGVWGGFVGVDIFFVISGYLITGIIQSELAAGNFSFARFYERRVRRLLPALYAMVALTAIPSFHYLLASERAEFFHSVVSVVTFTSNFFFWFQTGYFDHAAVEKPLLHTWSLAVEEQFYLALPLLLWGLARLAPGRRAALPVLLVGAHGGILCAQRLADAPRGFGQRLLHEPAARLGVSGRRHHRGERLSGAAKRTGAKDRARRGAGAAGDPDLFAAAGAGFSRHQCAGCRALGRPCSSGAASACRRRSEVRIRRFMSSRFFGQISYSLYLWHWPMFTFARFSKNSLVLDASDKVALFALTVAISWLSWRFVEKPFRERTLAPTRTGGIRDGGFGFGRADRRQCRRRDARQDTLAIADPVVSRLETYSPYKFEPFYRSGHCFNPASGVFGDDCLKLAPGKTNVLLWGDSLAAHYFHGLSKATDPQTTKILQATQAACMPTFNAAAQFLASCRNAATQMEAFFRDNKPDLVILSGDWLEYARPPRFDGMIADLRGTIARLNGLGIRVVLLGPPVQFKARLPQMLLRLHLRQAEAHADDLLLPDVFALDAKMRAALLKGGRFTYVSVLNAMCPARQCPVTLDGDVPLAWDHAHLTAEGSVAVMQRLVSMLGLEKQ